MPKISPCFVDDINRALLEAHPGVSDMRLR